MESLKDYNELHGHLDDSVRQSAEIIIPLLLELTNAKSVLDIGCGSGIWLKSFQDRGLCIRGLDGDYIDRSSLVIPPDRFRNADLAKPFQVEATDLAICLEVAEHLPETSADCFIESLTQAAPVIFFSAAIPGQGGMGHVNEQWPSYWKAKFENRGFIAFDAIRRRVWNDDRVLYWYAQNSLLFVRNEVLPKYPALAIESRDFLVDVVHPRRYAILDRAARAGDDPSLTHLAKSFPQAMKQFVKNKLGSPSTAREPVKMPDSNSER
jgi:SAM-dependent methyltransferase